MYRDNRHCPTATKFWTFLEGAVPSFHNYRVDAPVCKTISLLVLPGGPCDTDEADHCGDKVEQVMLPKCDKGDKVFMHPEGGIDHDDGGLRMRGGHATLARSPGS